MWSGLIDGEEARRKNIISYNTKICTKFMIGEEKPYFEHNDRFAFLVFASTFIYFFLIYNPVPVFGLCVIILQV